MTPRPASPPTWVRPMPFQKRRLVEIEFAPLRRYVLGQFRHAVIKARQRHLAIFRVKLADDFREHMDRIDDGTAEHAGMQIVAGAPQDHLLLHQSAQHDRDARRGRVPHAGVADEGQRRLRQFGLVGGEKFRQRRGAGLLLALEQEGHVARQSAIGLEGAAGLDESHELTLVVGGAARDDLLRPVALLQTRREGLGLPQFQRIGRLHVVMAVEQQMRRILALGARMADHDGMAGSRPQFGAVAQSLEFPHEPVGGALALLGVGRVGRDGRNAQQIEQPLRGGVDILVDGGENGFERGHGTALLVSPKSKSARRKPRCVLRQSAKLRWIFRAPPPRMFPL